MTKEECAKVLAVKYVYDYNTFRKSEKLRHDLAEIHFRYQTGDGDKEFEALFVKYSEELKRYGIGNPPRWAKMIMAENYALNI